MEVEVTAIYEGKSADNHHSRGLLSRHLKTDAPVDNCGKGERFFTD